ncbi:MAG: S-methyl-5-thioribose-1-phosphate isomerase [Clostridia bacterium]|nr:S-methyl-5-thioribose-1-phosphate isomerase [Clostridia bacterium]
MTEWAVQLEPVAKKIRQTRLIPISWDEREHAVRLIDQTLLPTELKYITVRTMNEMCEAIAMLRVRGAPAIGIAGAFGVYLGMACRAFASDEECLDALEEVCADIVQVRPTAVNLPWAVNRMKQAARLGVDDAHARGESADPSALFEIILAEAKAMIEEDNRACRAMGEYGAALIPDGASVLTHCNAGALATAGWGTALAALYVAQEQGKSVRVWADETRPLLQGSRLTAYELSEAGIDVTVICDNMAASLMARGDVDLIIVGADRVAANGDVCNKIGTYGLACLARMHGVPFFVACPVSTLDLSLASGDEIPIEQRDACEVSHGFGRQTAPDGVRVYNPAFDVTPNALITAIITERGTVRPPYGRELAAISSGE